MSERPKVSEASTAPSSSSSSAQAGVDDEIEAESKPTLPSAIQEPSMVQAFQIPTLMTSPSGGSSSGGSSAPSGGSQVASLPSPSGTPMCSTQTLTPSPSHTLMASLDDILAGQFGNIEETEQLAGEHGGSSSNRSSGDSIQVSQDPASAVMTGDNRRLSEQTRRLSNHVRHELLHEKSTNCAKLVESKSFTSFFMLLTMYALFVPDVDLLVGSKESKFNFSIVTSVVCLLFVVELVCQSVGRRKYFCKAYFWLDLVALVSLLPDTWFVQNMSSSNAFVAGRSSRLTKLIRIASRSSKATRLNRLARIVRVASLMPKLGALLGHRKNDEATEKLLEKKLRRVFTFLDEDMDGMIPRSAAMKCRAKMRNDEPEPTPPGEKLTLWQAATRLHPTLGKVMNKCVTSSPRGSDLLAAGGASSASSAWAAGDESEHNGRRSPAAPSPPGAMSDERSSAGMSNATGSTSTSSIFGTARSKFGNAVTKLRQVGVRNNADTDLHNDTEYEMSDLVKFEVFREVLMSDDVCAAKLRKSCQQQLRQGNNMKNLTSRHSEYIAVKVALGVLVLLFVLGLVEPDLQDLSAEKGLAHITQLVKLKYSNQTLRDTIPTLVHDQVFIWLDGVGLEPEKRSIIYLDIDKKLYCDEFARPGSCETAVENSTWVLRTSFSYIEQLVLNSDYRRVDLLPLRVPDFSDIEEFSDEELHRRTDSIVVIYVRSQAQYEAMMSIITTVLVTFIILGGIVLLTKDLTFLSRNLLKPLRELADDMESIAQLQLAGVAQAEDPLTINEGTSEVRLIRRTFENMKKAIKSWGKYVPWPVVQLLLRANVEANLEVKEVEVTIYFSDIASFTTIVENMPPESSLLLLSRYFNDMSKVIDDHGGVVLEFIGDAILCIYGAPLVNLEHPQAGAKSALRMLAALRRMNEWSARRDLPDVQIRCGVHTGRVLVGNMGFHSRMKYGIVGEDAHIPSRLEEINKTYGTKMMISHNTWLRLDTTRSFITRPADIVHLRLTRDAECEMIYEVMDRERHPSNKENVLWEPAALHTEAMELYRKCRFDAALNKFKMVSQMMSDITGVDDEASLLMIRRCSAYQDHPPPRDWNGVWDQSKS